jgi:hypothetical protein
MKRSSGKRRRVSGPLPNSHKQGKSPSSAERSVLQWSIFQWSVLQRSDHWQRIRQRRLSAWQKKHPYLRLPSHCQKFHLRGGAGKAGWVAYLLVVASLQQQVERQADSRGLAPSFQKNT